MIRLDVLLVERGLTPSRAQARAAIEAGGVTVDGRVETSPSRKVAPEVVKRGEQEIDKDPEYWADQTMDQLLARVSPP